MRRDQQPGGNDRARRRAPQAGVRAEWERYKAENPEGRQSRDEPIEPDEDDDDSEEVDDRPASADLDSQGTSKAHESENQPQ